MGDLPAYADADWLTSQFASTPGALRSNIVRPRGTEGFLYGFVTFSSHAEAAAALALLNNQPWAGSGGRRIGHRRLRA